MNVGKLKMSKDEHIQRHKMLHQMLDELLADFLRHTNCEKLPSCTTIEELMVWSSKQTVDPDEE